MTLYRASVCLKPFAFGSILLKTFMYTEEYQNLDFVEKTVKTLLEAEVICSYRIEESFDDGHSWHNTSKVVYMTNEVANLLRLG